MHDLKMPRRIDLEAIFVQVDNKICPLDPIGLGDFYDSHHSTIIKMAAEVRKTWKQAIQAEYQSKSSRLLKGYIINRQEFSKIMKTVFSRSPTNSDRVFVLDAVSSHSYHFLPSDFSLLTGKKV